MAPEPKQKESFKETIGGRRIHFMVEHIDKPMQFKDGQPVRTSSPEVCTRSSDTSIDEQTAAALLHFSQILKADRYAIYVSLTFTFAVMWSNKSSPTSGPVCDTCSSPGSVGGPQIVSAGSSSNDRFCQG